MFNCDESLISLGSRFLAALPDDVSVPYSKLEESETFATVVGRQHLDLQSNLLKENRDRISEGSCRGQLTCQVDQRGPRPTVQQEREVR